jgi:hypothetical protein
MCRDRRWHYFTAGYYCLPAAIEHTYREAMKTAKSNIAVNHALHWQLADLDVSMRRMAELLDQKCRTMMYSLPRAS